MMMHAQLKQYQQVNRETAVVDADPHRLIQMLLEGGLERLAVARGCIERNDIQGRNHFIGKAIDIIGGLRGVLDLEQGGELAANLDNLYDYMQRRLFDANRHNSAEYLDEVVNLLKTVKDGWDGIRDQAVGQSAPA